MNNFQNTNLLVRLGKNLFYFIKHPLPQKFGLPYSFFKQTYNIIHFRVVFRSADSDLTAK